MRAHDMGAESIALTAGRSAILFYRARKLLAETPNSYLMPNALKLEESITETAAEMVRTKDLLPDQGTMVVSISSGTVAAGVLLGMKQIGLDQSYSVILHAGYSRSETAVRAYIQKCLGFAPAFTYVDQGYQYKDKVDNKGIPFPCNEHYDAKAWNWLTDNIQNLSAAPIVFWNIGD
jgi:hypothetical protein